MHLQELLSTLEVKCYTFHLAELDRVVSITIPACLYQDPVD
jgi:hypothetical protein